VRRIYFNNIYFFLSIISIKILCNVCNDDINDEDELNYAIYNGLPHLRCVELRKFAFSDQQKWCCSKCKFSKNPKSKIIIKNTTEDNETHAITN
jgi:hypothetical protein